MLYWFPFPSKPAQQVSDRLKTVHLSLDVMAVSPWGLYTDGVAGSSEVKNKWKDPGFTAQLLLICWNHGSCHLWDPHVVERKKQKEAGAGEWLPMGGPLWGSPQFVQLCWCLMSAPPSKQQWERIPMKSNTQDCISLCALWVVQKQVKYWKKNFVVLWLCALLGMAVSAFLLLSVVDSEW